ncbi:hypothetical protein AALO_G00046660 [Alosa alosa]|uniref:Uncharacterized protein n=1 Tax=Alosa alosa TaxID=278164 RepID=A0AAV6HCT1_9TELE|nr:uncharacterized protein LOC125291968 isoform X2 [Alosa alosa]XP_048094988.1 uncharacterized protein LOC125291968 isoform X2 [Alosa alosa]KAG5283835.1 hypothetical protein AALO_G00046660 [Alosa alosa]
MAEALVKRTLPPPQPPAAGKKPRSESQIKSDKKRNRTRVNIGTAFHRWRQLMDMKEMRFDSELATFLLDWYEGPLSSTPMKKRAVLRDLTLTSIGSSDSDKDKHASEKASKASAGVEELARLECSLGEMSIGEEEHLDEKAINDLRNSTIDWAVNPPPVKASDTDDEEQDSSDEEYIPPLSLRLGGALPNVPNFDALPVIGLEETVHDLTADFESEPSTDPDSSTALAADSNVPTVQKAEDIVGAKASIVYDDCLKYLAAFVTPPVKRCTAIKVTGATCQRHPPFLVNIKGKGTASMLEWSCADGHIVWRWVSQPLMKYGLHRLYAEHQHPAIRKQLR